MIEIKIDAAEIHAALNRLQSKVSNLSPALESIGNAIENRTKLNFRDGQDPYGVKWQAKKNGEASHLKGRTGHLSDSITHVVNQYLVSIGTNVPYAAIHQFGGTIAARNQTNAHSKSGRFMSREAAGKRKTAVRVSFSKIGQGKMPARPFLPDASKGLPDDYSRIILDDINRYLSKL